MVIFVQNENLRNVRKSTEQNLGDLSFLHSDLEIWVSVYSELKITYDTFLKGVAKVKEKIKSIRRIERTLLVDRKFEDSLDHTLQQLSQNVAKHKFHIDAASRNFERALYHLRNGEAKLLGFRKTEIPIYEELLRSYTSKQELFLVKRLQIYRLEEELRSVPETDLQHRELSLNLKRCDLEISQFYNSYADAYIVFVKRQDEFAKSHNQLKQLLADLVIAVIENFQTNIAQYIRECSTLFRMESTLPEYEAMKSRSARIRIMFRQISVDQEIMISFECFNFFRRLKEFQEESGIFKEMQSMNFKFADTSRINNLLLRLFTRDITSKDFLSEGLMIDKRIMPLLVRYLYIFLLAFEDLRRVTSKQANSIARILVDTLVDYFGVIEGDYQDLHFMFYVLKIGELIKFKADGKVSMMGKLVNELPLLEAMNLPRDSLIMIEKTEFWANFYRQNICFLISNYSLLEFLKTVKGKSCRINILDELESDEHSDFEEGNSIISVLDPEEQVSSWGESAESLGCVIRYMIYLHFKLSVINTICREITQINNIDEHLAYRVFKQTEDEFTTRYYPKSIPDPYPSFESELEKRANILLNLFDYLAPQDIIKLLYLSKITSKIIKPNLSRHILSAYQIQDRSTRLYLWSSLMGENHRNRQLREGKIEPQKGGAAEIIIKDLKRSVQFLKNEDDYSQLYDILTNIALDYPEIGYYQGMNYIAVFLYYAFNCDSLKTYQFMSYVVETHLANRFGEELKGLMKLLFLCDKLMQKTLGMVWNKLSKCQITSVHFSVSPILTVFTSFIKSGDVNNEIILVIWDLFLAGGFKNVIKTLLYLLELQQSYIYKAEAETVLLSIKNIETTPLNIMKYLKVEDPIISSTMSAITKEGIRSYFIPDIFYERLLQHYEFIHKPILDFWGDKYTF